ncbi:MAG: methyltransferase [Bacteroidales bacterium]|nr:methyltransferase [Bacteroidales bacterium]
MPFDFKQFSIQDKNSAMKVGIDSVLLGAWADIAGSKKILDLGAGTGVLSIMLAQRFNNIEIDAIEIDSSANIDLRNNVNNCPWKESINPILDDFLNFDFSSRYNLIISNPPYYIASESNIERSRKTARIANILTPDKLCNRAFEIIEDEGKLIVIYPFMLREDFIKAAFKSGFFLYSELIISDTINAKAKRSILCFSKEIVVSPKLETFILKIKEGGYSQQFKDLTKEFYLD